MATAQDYWADICSDGTEVQSPRVLAAPNPGVDFGGNFQVLPEEGLFVRAVSGFGNQYAIVKGWVDDHAWIIDSSGTQHDLGITFGNYCVAIQLTATGVRVVWVNGIGTYKTQSFSSALVSAGAAVETAIPAPSTQTTQGMLDLLSDGTPIWTDQRFLLNVKGTNLVRPVFRAGWWIGQSDGNQLPDGIYGVHYLNGRRLLLHGELAFEPHAATADSGTEVLWAIRTLDGTAAYGFIDELVDPSLQDILETGQIGTPLQMPPYKEPITERGTGHVSRPWFQFFQSVSSILSQPVNLADTTGILNTDHGGVNPTPSGDEVKAPRDAEYIVAVADNTLSAERVATNTSTAVWDFATAGQAKVHAVGGAGSGAGVPAMDGEDGETLVIPGPMGPQGATGATGAAGPAGGPMGPPGVDGEDAELLIIPGPKGDTGSGGGVPSDTVLTPAAYASIPAAATAGRVFLPTDGVSMYRDSGSAWAPWGPLFPCTPPVDGDFSWVNQGGASVDTTYGGIYLLAPANSGESLRIRIKTAPATPYTVTAAFLPQLVNINYQRAGLCWRQSSDGKVVMAYLLNAATATTYQVDKFNTATSPNSVYATWATNQTGLTFIRITDDGTDRVVSYSTDGQHWVQLHTIGRTDFMTADQVGFFAADDSNSLPAAMTLLSWKET